MGRGVRGGRELRQERGYTPAVGPFPSDEIAVAGLTLRGVAAGGVQTCLMVPELGLMFDVGGVPPGALKFETILVTHGHQDHLGALPYLISQRQLMRAKKPHVHVPVEIEAPLRRILTAWEEIEDFEFDVSLVGHGPGDRFDVRRDLVATCLRSSHRVPSLAWVVIRRTERLRVEYRARSGEEIKALKAAGEPITQAHETPLLCVTGDTRIDLFRDEPLVRKCRVLVHEVTSWDDRRDVAETRKWGHTHVDEMIAHAEAFEGDALVLVHRSLRHGRRQAQEVVDSRFPASLRDRIHVFGA